MRSQSRIFSVVGTALLLGSLGQIASAEEPERLFLQQVGPKSAILKWRGDADQACVAKKIRHLSRNMKSRKSSKSSKSKKVQ